MEIIFDDAGVQGLTMNNSFKLTSDPHVQIEDIRFLVNQMTIEDTREVIIDLNDVAILDSVLIGQLVRMQLSLRDRGMTLILRNLNRHAQAVLRYSNLESMFDLSKAEPPTWGDANITTF